MFPCVNTIRLNEYLAEQEEQDKYYESIEKEYEELCQDFTKSKNRQPTEPEEYILWDKAESILQAKIENFNNEGFY